MTNDTLVAIDAMYIVYHSIFRTIRIWQYKNKLEADEYLTPKEDGTQNNLLKSDTFKAGLNMSIIHTCTRINDIITDAFPQYAGLEPSAFATQLFILDDKTGNGFRRKIYPEYKQSRVTSQLKQAFDLGEIRAYILHYLLDELDIWNRLGYTKVFIENAEADDVIYMTMTTFADKFTNRLVISSDHDLLQIPNVLQYNLEGKLITRKTRKTDELMSCRDFLLRKILMGDGSDNIPATFPRCGFVKAEKLLNDQALLKQSLMENTEAAKQFAINKSLIDISKMPTELANNINAVMTDILNKITPSTPSVKFEALQFDVLASPL